MIQKIVSALVSLATAPVPLLSVVALGLAFSVACCFSARHSLQTHTALLCDIVEEGIYLKNNVMEEWTDHCRKRALRGEYGSSKQKAIWMFDQELTRLPISHLHTYQADETQQMWENQAVDNGLRVRLIEDAFIVYEILKDSPAEKAGFQLGDQIQLVNEQELNLATEVTGVSGDFKVKRVKDAAEKIAAEKIAAKATAKETAGNVISIHVKAVQLFDDLKPKREILAPHVSRLRLASFLPQYFDGDDWRKVIEEMKDDTHVVIDLRGNAGGAFPAMLRALSPFFCAPETVGFLTSDRDAFHIKSPDKGGAITKSDVGETANDDAMADDNDTQKQLDRLEANSQLRLRTFADYGCVKANITALVDADTSSVSEIFAWALKLRPKNLPAPRVLGVPTAGQVVMARWFDLTPLSFSGYQLSIPIATFLTPQGLELEGEGITPQRLLFYDLAKARAGRDSWLETAVSK